MVQHPVLRQELRDVRSAGDAGGARRRRGGLATERALGERRGGGLAHEGTGQFSYKIPLKGCVNSRPAARENQEGKFTQPRDNPVHRDIHGCDSSESELRVK